MKLRDNSIPDPLLLTPNSKKSPWRFVPTLYFAEGLPYVMINSVSVILYKRFGLDNTAIAFWTSLLYIPWVIKMLWGPYVDIFSTKRNWILYTQVSFSILMGVVCLTIYTPYFFVLSLCAFALAAFVSATHDIAADGFYMLALSKENQALFVGIRSFFYRVAMIFGSGILIYFAGEMEDYFGDIRLSWSFAITAVTLIFFLIYSYHARALPWPSSDDNEFLGEGPRVKGGNFLEIILSYFRQKRVWAILGFILFYRLGEAMLVKMVSPFLLDHKSVGGMGLTTSEVGLSYGTFGVTALIVGGIFGGWAISKWGIKRCLWPMVLALNLPDLFYVYMAYTQPSLGWVYSLVFLEQLGYGLGFSAFMVLLMRFTKEEYKTAHYAISTGFMALGMMIPGMISGYIQEKLGYSLFFWVVCAVTIPGMLMVFFVPIEEK